MAQSMVQGRTVLRRGEGKYERDRSHYWEGGKKRNKDMRGETFEKRSKNRE